MPLRPRKPPKVIEKRTHKFLLEVTLSIDIYDDEDVREEDYPSHDEVSEALIEYVEEGGYGNDVIVVKDVKDDEGNDDEGEFCYDITGVEEVGAGYRSVVLKAEPAYPVSSPALGFDPGKFPDYPQK
jgi:hypothetical protein